MGDFLVLGILAVIICAILRKMVRDKKDRKTCYSGCSGNCGSCPHRK